MMGDIIRDYRRLKKKLKQEVSANDVHSGWIKNKKLVFILKTNFKQDSLKRFKEDLIKELRKYSPFKRSLNQR